MLSLSCNHDAWPQSQRRYMLRRSNDSGWRVQVASIRYLGSRFYHGLPFADSFLQ